MRISVVSYFNSRPFLFALQHFNRQDMEWDTAVPSECARKLLTGQADIGLVPVAVIPHLKQSFLVSDYCIGACREVHSVMLFSHVPFHQVHTILLDNQSRTSALLVKLLAEHHWKINPSFVHEAEVSGVKITGRQAALVIGDRALLMRNEYPFQIDLAAAWYEMTGLPFVFACWVSNKPVSDDFKKEFNRVMQYGVLHRKEVAQLYDDLNLPVETRIRYLTEIIRYELTSEMKKGMNLFLEMIQVKTT